MIIGLNLDRELDSGYPEELSEYEWSYLYSLHSCYYSWLL